jgi:hypothetical protein
MNRILEMVGRKLGIYLTRERHTRSSSPLTDLAQLRGALRPADVLLVEGNSRISTAIKPNSVDMVACSAICWKRFAFA